MWCCSWWVWATPRWRQRSWIKLKTIRTYLRWVTHFFNAPILFSFYLSILTSALCFDTKITNVWNVWVVRLLFSLSPSITLSDSFRTLILEFYCIVTFWGVHYFSSLTKCERCDYSKIVTEFVCLYKILLITYFINDFKWQHNRLRYGCENCVRISTDTQFFSLRFRVDNSIFNKRKCVALTQWRCCRIRRSRNRQIRRTKK